MDKKKKEKKKKKKKNSKKKKQQTNQMRSVTGGHSSYSDFVNFEKNTCF